MSLRELDIQQYEMRNFSRYISFITFPLETIETKKKYNRCYEKKMCHKVRESQVKIGQLIVYILYLILIN